MVRVARTVLHPFSSQAVVYFGVGRMVVMVVQPSCIRIVAVVTCGGGVGWMVKVIGPSRPGIVVVMGSAVVDA